MPPGRVRARRAAAAPPPGRAARRPRDRARPGLPLRQFARVEHPLTHRRRRLGRLARELCRPRPRDRHHEVEAVDQRARELVPEGREPLSRARAREPRVAPPTAGAEVHRRDELEARREDASPLDAGDADDAVLERLAQRLERGPLKLDELIEEQHAAVGERRLAGARARSAADQGGHRRAVVRRPKGRRVDERPLRREEPGDRVDARDLEGRLVVEGREDSRQAAREHRLPGAGRAGEEEVVPAGRRDLEGPPGALLAAHVGEVGEAQRRRAAAPVGQPLGLLLAAQVADRLDEVADRHGLDACERDLACGLGRAQHAPESGPPGALGDDQRAADRPDAPVQCELADARVAGNEVGGHLPRRGQDRERDREVVAGALLLQSRGREVDGHAPARPLGLGRGDAAADALLRLLASAVCQADDRERGEAAAQVRLDLDAAGIETDERVCESAREHCLRRYGRTRHARVPILCRKRGARARLKHVEPEQERRHGRRHEQDAEHQAPSAHLDARRRLPPAGVAVAPARAVPRARAACRVRPWRAASPTRPARCAARSARDPRSARPPAPTPCAPARRAGSHGPRSGPARRRSAPAPALPAPGSGPPCRRRTGAPARRGP